jgi:CheY-like chemotaxis protein
MATIHRFKHTAPRKRILVVEDDLDSVHSMALLIKMMGHEVQFAINAWRRSTSRAASAPTSSSSTSAARLRGRPHRAPAALRAGARAHAPHRDLRPAQEHLEQRALRAGCEEFYRKPIEPSVLEALLSRPRAPTRVQETR